MKLITGDQVNVPRDTYKVVLTFNHGNGNQVTYEEMYVKKKYEPVLSSFMESVVNSANLNNIARYSELERWHCDDFIEYEDMTGVNFQWHMDSTTYFEDPAILLSVKLTYFSPNGIEYKVRIE